MRSESKTDIEIPKEIKVPVSTIYRKIEILPEARLITVSCIINTDRKKVFYYQSRIGKMKIQFENENLDMSINFKKILLSNYCLKDKLGEETLLTFV